MITSDSLIYLAPAQGQFHRGFARHRATKGVPGEEELEEALGVPPQMEGEKVSLLDGAEEPVENLCLSPWKGRKGFAFDYSLLTCCVF